MRFGQDPVSQKCSALETEIRNLLSIRADIRKRERDLIQQEQAFASEFQLRQGSSDASLEANMRKILPSHLVPGNVGNIDRVAWPFYYEVEFDFGTDPTLTSATRQTQGFQVSQEAGFLLMGAYFDADEENSESGQLGPYQVEIRDRQSSRQFNDRPIPVQMLGRDSRPTRLPTPMLILPNASVDMIVSSFVPAGISVATLGESKIRFTLSGLRVRVDDDRAVLSTIFGQ